MSHAILKEEPDGTLRVNTLAITANNRNAHENDLKIRLTSRKDIQEVIKAHHESKEIGHPGINKTIQLI